MTKSKIITLDPQKARTEYLKEAVEIISNGGLVIIPTETVYGIAANALNKQAIDRLYEIKQRPKHKPFSLLIDKNGMESFCYNIPISAYKLAEKFWPGPLTMILNSKDGTSLGLRIPDNAIAAKVIELVPAPLVCPSANLSGKPAPTDFNQAIADLDGLVDLAIDAGPTKLGIESSVVDLTQDSLKILREAAIKRAEIEQAVAKKTVLFVCTGNSCRSVMAAALLEKKLKMNNRQDVEVLSAGMIPGPLRATEATQEVLARQGIDVSGHRSQMITSAMIRKSDFILVMEKSHEEKILDLVPEAKKRVFLLKEFAKIDGGDLNIEDPIGRPLAFYEKTLEIIKEAVERIVEII